MQSVEGFDDMTVFRLLASLEGQAGPSVIGGSKAKTAANPSQKPDFLYGTLLRRRRIDALVPCDSGSVS